MNPALRSVIVTGHKPLNLSCTSTFAGGGNLLNFCLVQIEACENLASEIPALIAESPFCYVLLKPLAGVAFRGAFMAHTLVVVILLGAQPTCQRIQLSRLQRRHHIN